MAANYRKDTVVYQIYPRSFCDSDGDGMGDLKGILSKLDYIADLGVNTIWLSPIYLSPDDDNGYDIADYKAIQPRFGTMEDFDLLVAEAKKRGIGIVMDLVINHTSDEHAWFQRALAGEEKYQNYYIIRPGKKNGNVPNNWGNFFADCPWAPFGDTGKYYLHLFSKKQPDLNWHNPEVLEEIKEIMRFWLEKGVVGFRCDVINVIYKNTLADGKKRFILTGQEHYLSTPGCHKILQELRRDVLEPYGAFAVGETVFVDLPQARDLTLESRGELDMVFAFQHMECDQVIVKWLKTRLKPKRLMKCLSKWQTGLPWNACYFENHDQPRFISRFSDSQGYRKECSRMMAGILMTLRGTPYVFQGQEIGMTNGDFANLQEVEDIESHNVHAMMKRLCFPSKLRWKLIRRSSRDNARTPVQWSSGKNAGFTKGEKPWLKLNGNYKTVNVEKELADGKGVLAFWKRMIRLRKENEILCSGDFTPLLESKRVYAYRRSFEGKSLICICNMTSKAAAVPKNLNGKLLLSSYEQVQAEKLQPFEFRMLQEG